MCYNVVGQFHITFVKKPEGIFVEHKIILFVKSYDVFVQLNRIVIFNSDNYIFRPEIWIKTVGIFFGSEWR